GGANDAGVFILGQREELACAARGKQRAGVVALQPFKALLIRRLVEVLLRIKISERKRQQPCSNDALQLLYIDRHIFLIYTRRSADQRKAGPGAAAHRRHAARSDK